MKDIVGQISLVDFMDFLSPQTKPNEPQILLYEGQKVYKVFRGDVGECIVTGEKSWICGENNRGYRLKRIDGCWDVTWNDSIGLNVFTDLHEAHEKAENYIRDNDCIRAKDINAKEVVAYRYLYDSREITQFYAVLDDGTVYYRYGGMYEHIGSKKEIAKFENERNENRKRHLGYEEIKDYYPVFVNMYKCSNSDWLYATARYQYIDG